jgi:lipopolysaccharide heptosyltransferase II
MCAVKENSIGASTGWAHARRILCVRLDAMGDVLMTGPAIRAIKNSPAAPHVTLLTSRSGSIAGALLPGVDEIITYDPPWMKATTGRSEIGPDMKMIERLRSMKFDAAIIFTVYSQNPLPAALLCYLAGIPLRIAHCRENPYQLLTDWIREIEPETTVRHEVERQLALAKSAGFEVTDKRMSVRVSFDAKQRVRDTLRSFGVDADSRSWVVFHPGASAASRRYPADRFGASAAELVRWHGYRVVLTGDANERQMIDEIRALVDGPRVVSLCGRIDFEELAALISFAPVVVSNNSSPVHLAAALGTPVVDLYALTNPQHTPWLVSNRVLFSDVPCKFCYKSVCPEGHHECLRGVSPDRVVRAVLELLEESEKEKANTGRHAKRMVAGII